MEEEEGGAVVSDGGVVVVVRFDCSADTDREAELAPAAVIIDLLLEVDLLLVLIEEFDLFLEYLGLSIVY